MQYREAKTPPAAPIRRKVPGFKQILRWIFFSPYYLLRLIVLLPVAIIKFLVRLPRRIWWAWTQGALLIVKLRMGIGRLWHWRGVTLHWLRLHVLPGRIYRGLYVNLHPRRWQHRWGVLRTRLHPAIWDARPELGNIPKSIQWARHYRRHQSRFRDIEALRSILYANDTVLEQGMLKATVGYWGRRISIDKRWGALLHGLVRYSEAQRVLELGAGYGISSLYMAQGLLDNYPVRTCMLITLEKDPERADIVYEHFYRLGFDDFAEVAEGDIEDTLPGALEDIQPLNLAFIDGPTDENLILRYFSQIKRHSRPGTLVILANVHWSRDMTHAWRTIKDMRGVTATVDLWYWGIVLIGSGPPVHVCARL